MAKKRGRPRLYVNAAARKRAQRARDKAARASSLPTTASPECPITFAIRLTRPGRGRWSESTIGAWRNCALTVAVKNPASTETTDTGIGVRCVSISAVSVSHTMTTPSVVHHLDVGVLCGEREDRTCYASLENIGCRRLLCSYCFRHAPAANRLQREAGAYEVVRSDPGPEVAATGPGPQDATSL